MSRAYAGRALDASGSRIAGAIGMALALAAGLLASCLLPYLSR